MSYDEFKQKLGYGARPSIFEVEIAVPKQVASALGKDTKGIAADLKFFVSATQIPGRTIGAVTVNYQGEEVKLTGDVTYEDIAYTFLNDMNYFARDVIEAWAEFIVDPITNQRSTPSQYKQTIFVYHVSNEVDGTGEKKRIKGWKLEGAFPTSFAAIDKAWDTKDTVETNTFTLRFDKFKRVTAQGQEV